MAHRLAAHLGCGWVLDEWSPSQPVRVGALHLTNVAELEHCAHQWLPLPGGAFGDAEVLVLPDEGGASMSTAPHPDIPAPDALLLGQWLAEPGHVHIAALRRAPYARSADWGLTDVRALTSAEAADLLSAPSSASTASTSAFEGLLSTLSAMAAAVRNRSYVLMAANSSDSGALARLNLSSLASKASTAFLDGMSISILEIDHCAAGQGGSESARTNSSSAAPAPAGNSALPAIGAPLDGGQFAGVISQPNGTVTAVVLLPGHAENLTFALAPGERYAGVVLDADGRVQHHLVLLASQGENLTHPQAIKWAASVGGQLPTRQEQALLYANCKPHLHPRWHWSSETYEADASCAWGCDFISGYQLYGHESWQACAVAVRRLAA